MANTYWNSNGKYQFVGDLLNKRIPREGEVSEPKKNPALEKFRKASNVYYDLYNNNLCNRAAQFKSMFGIATSSNRYLGKYGWVYSEHLFATVETRMDEIILAAAIEQGFTLHLEAVV